MSISILILAAGATPSEKEHDYPLFLSEFESKPLIEKITDQCKTLSPERIIYAFRDDVIRKFHLKNIVKILFPTSIVVKTPTGTRGAACTALLAISHIENDDELLIINGNEFLDIDFKNVISDFQSRQLDAGVAVFKSIHPRYSYVRLNENNLVEEAAEKKPISNMATAGFYWYKHGNDFVNACKQMIRKGESVEGNFYVCPAFNQLILDDKMIGIHQIDGSKYHPIKNMRQLDNFESSQYTLTTR